MRSSSPVSARRVKLVPPACEAGVTDGSERGDYVPQRHLLDRFGRPHHVINLMYQYYPELPGWPTRGVKKHGCYKNVELMPGDGYFPLVIEHGGEWGQRYLRQIEEVRAFGQEPLLTLTLHADTPDEILVRIARSLAPYAPMRVRINHETNGTWFHFHRRASFGAISDMFVRFHNILHDHAPGVRTAACWNGSGGDPTPAKKRVPPWGDLTEQELAPMFRIADTISFDLYASLHYGWPNPGHDPAREKMFFHMPVEEWWAELVRFHDRMCDLRGRETGIELHEINTDADVTGFDGQAAWITRFYAEAASGRYPWLSNITFYMFRDRGGLGLELEDLEDPTAYRELPSLSAYREAIRGKHFELRLRADAGATEAGPLTCTWSSPSDAAGWRFSCHAPAATWRFTEDAHLLVRSGGTWTLKPRGVSEVVVQTAQTEVDVFAPPPDGRNNRPGGFAAVLPGMPHAVTQEVNA